MLKGKAPSCWLRSARVPRCESSKAELNAPRKWLARISLSRAMRAAGLVPVRVHHFDGSVSGRAASDGLQRLEADAVTLLLPQHYFCVAGRGTPRAMVNNTVKKRKGPR